MEYNNITYETDGRVAIITLNRPEKLNPLSHALRGEVYDAMKEAEYDQEIGVIILKANGRAFSAGYDLAPQPEESEYVSHRSGMPDTGSTHPQHYDWSRHALMGHWMIWELAKPVIAQVHGYCLAGGTELTSMCDMRIVARDARIGYPPVRAMGTMDIVQLHGGSPANFLDVGGGATKERVTEAFKIILSDENVAAVLVNIFGGIVRCDLIAEGVIGAVEEVGVEVPVVVRLEGNNAELGREVLEKSGLNIIAANSLSDAAEKVVGAAGGAA